MVVKEFKLSTLCLLYLNNQLQFSEVERFTDSEVKFYLENNLPVNAEIIEGRDDNLVIIAPKFLIYAIQECELYRNNLVRAVVFNEYEYLNYKNYKL